MSQATGSSSRRFLGVMIVVLFVLGVGLSSFAHQDLTVETKGKPVFVTEEIEGTVSEQILETLATKVEIESEDRAALNAEVSLYSRSCTSEFGVNHKKKSGSNHIEFISSRETRCFTWNPDDSFEEGEICLFVPDPFFEGKMKYEKCHIAKPAQHPSMLLTDIPKIICTHTAQAKASKACFKVQPRPADDREILEIFFEDEG